MSDNAIKHLIAAYVPHPDLLPYVHETSTSLSELRLDDSDRVALAVDIEDAYGIIIHDETLHNWGTVADVLETAGVTL